MNNIRQSLVRLISSPFFPYLVLISIICSIYYKFFIFGKIPFPGDLLVVSYSPWFDRYKFPVQNPLISDVFSQFFLWKYLSIESFKSLQFPLWNPYSFMGTPLLATYHSAVLYPFNILLLLPKYFGWGAYIFAQSLLASISMYLFLSLYLNSKIARLTGSIIFAFGGLMTTWLELGTAGHAIAWLPLCLFLVTQYGKGFKLRYPVLLTFVLSSLILAGNAQITTYSFAVIIIYAMVIFLNKNLKISFIHLLPILISLLLAISICSPQLLTSLDIFKKSIRVGDSYTSEYNFGLLNLKDGIKFFVADFFGSPVSRNYWGFLNYSETSGFVGSLTLPLLIFSFLYLKRTKVMIFFQITLLLSLLLTFDNPISHIIYTAKIPLLTSSYASRMLFITSLAISVLSAFSLNQILSQHEENKLFKSVIYSVAALTGILVGSFILYKIIQNIISSAPSKLYAGVYLKDNDYTLPNFIVSIRNTIIPIGFVSSFLFIGLIIRRFKFFSKKISTIGLLLMIILTIDLGRYFLKFNPFVPQELAFPKMTTLTYLQNQPGLFRIGREHAEVLPPNTWTAYNLSSFEGYDPIYLNEYAIFIHFLNGGDIRESSTGRYAELASGYSSPYLDAANVKYFIAILRDKNGQMPGDLLNYQFNETNYKLVFKDHSSAILENPNALERVYFAKAYKISDIAQAKNIIMTEKTFDPRKDVLLSNDLHLDSVTGNGNAEITKYSPNQVKIKTITNHEELLILADQFDEGWKANIDGQETPISRANLIFRGIRIPQGNHQITFDYWPSSFELGLKITITTIIALIIISLMAIQKRVF